MRDEVTRQCPQTTTFEEKGEPKRIRSEVLLLTSLTPYHWAKPAHLDQRRNYEDSKFQIHVGFMPRSDKSSLCAQIRVDGEEGWGGRLFFLLFCWSDYWASIATVLISRGRDALSIS